MKSRLIPALMALGLVACSTAPELPAGYAVNEARQEGIAIVSLTLSGKSLSQVESFAYRLREVPPRDSNYATVTRHYDSPRQHARSIWEADKDRPFARDIVVKGLDSSEPLDIQEAGKPIGRVATLRLVPGEYEIHAWRLRESAPGGSTEYAPPRDFSYRFSVEPGRATYLGRIDLKLSDRRTERLAIENRLADDMPLLARKIPNLGAAEVVAAVGRISR